jgi:NitT/TauT family transport system permease protein
MARLNRTMPDEALINIKYRRVMSTIIQAITNDKVLWIGSPIVILFLWEGFARSGLIQPIVLPAPSVIFQMLFSLLASGELWPHIYMSLFRAISGFAVGSILGILLGLMMGWSRWVDNIADIPFNVLRAIPKAALVPVFIVWFGIGEFPKVLIVTLVPFVMCTINTTAGVKDVDSSMIKAARSLGAKDKDIIKDVVIPSACPMIFAALRLSIVTSLVMLVIAEMVAAERGLGAYIMESQRLFHTAEMFAGIVIIAAFAYSLDIIVRKVERRVLRWHKGIAITGV